MADPVEGTSQKVLIDRVYRDEHHGLQLWPIRRALAAALLVGLLLTVVLAVIVLFLLGFPGIERRSDVSIKIFFDILKLAFGTVVGAGAALALVMTYRKQRVIEAENRLSERAQVHAEKVAEDNAHDSTERRITELYGKTVEQLGHANAAVRLGGLYSLERLAQAHPEHRQTAVDMICAYLRMPFQAPTDPMRSPPAPQAVARAEGGPDQTAGDRLVDAESKQELQVRLTAQRLLARHLIPESSDNANGEPGALPDTYWEGMRLDLTGALLIDFDFSGCRPYHADFRRAIFTGPARFRGAWFSGHAVFEGARFCGNAVFDGVCFSGNAWFGWAEFSRRAWFGWAEFRERAWFRGAQFESQPDFHDACAAHPRNGHRWPPGWRLETPPTGEPMARLLRDSTPVRPTDSGG